MKLTGYCYVLKKCNPDNPITGFTESIWSGQHRDDYHWYRVTVEVPDPFPIKEAKVVEVAEEPL